MLAELLIILFELKLFSCGKSFFIDCKNVPRKFWFWFSDLECSFSFCHTMKRLIVLREFFEWMHGLYRIFQFCKFFYKRKRRPFGRPFLLGCKSQRGDWWEGVTTISGERCGADGDNGGAEVTWIFGISAWTQFLIDRSMMSFPLSLIVNIFCLFFEFLHPFCITTMAIQNMDAVMYEAMNVYKIYE